MAASRGPGAINANCPEDSVSPPYHSACQLAEAPKASLEERF